MKQRFKSGFLRPKQKQFMFKRLGFSAVMFLGTMVAMAQDPHFSQFYANPLYLNPALTGSSIGPRYLLNYRNQWSSIPGFATYAASFDQYVDKMQGGIGFQAMSDNAGAGLFTQTRVSASYAHFLKLNNKWSLRSGFRASYGQFAVNNTNWTFNDQLDPKLGIVRPVSSEPLYTLGIINRNYADFAAGFMAFSENLYGGVAFDHVTTPNISIIQGGFTELPVRVTVNAGANFVLNKFVGTSKPQTIVSPNLIYMQHGPFSQLNLGAYVNREPFTAGVWYRQSGGNADAVILLGGIQTKNFRFGYSYDITVSRLRQAATGAHELSVGFMLDKYTRPSKKKIERIKCPAF